MKISGFTIARNVIKFNYPVVESIKSILPICDEFVVNVGDSQDNTLDLIKSIKNPKIRIIEKTWDMSQGKEVLSSQTNLALEQCTGDWAFYLQTDEVIHEKDLSRLKSLMEENFDKDIDALRFKWLHFYRSYFRYRIDRGWYQKQDRIIRNNGQIESYGDAYAFRRKDGDSLKLARTNVFLYPYGWVQPQNIMLERRRNARDIGFANLTEQESLQGHNLGDLNRFPAYFGSHPKEMEEKVNSHKFSQEDFKSIARRFWWHPARILKLRYKTFKRVKERIV